MRLRVAIGVLGALLAVGAPPALAAPGDLDPTFGEHGIGPAESEAGDHLVLQDGRILTLASAGSGGYVRRFEPDGTADASFGDGGEAVIEDGVDARAMATGADGRITVVGQQYGTPPYRIRVVRFLADGQPDPSLGGDGQVTLDLGTTGVESPEDVAVDADGTTLIAGKVDENQAVIGLDDEGELDPAFADSGVLMLPEGTAVDIDPAPGGDYIVAGLQRFSPIVMFTRLTAGGDLVESYGTDGSRAVVGRGGTYGYPAGDIAVAPSGRLAYGSTFSDYLGKEGVISPQLIVLDPQGDVDGGFDLNPALGIAGAGKSQSIEGLAWDGSGRLIVSGSEIRQNYPYSGSSIGYLARFLPDGAPDLGFGEAGINRYPADFSTFPAASIAEPAMMSDGRILASAGRLVRFLDGGAVANLDADALPDDSDSCPLRYADRANGCARVRVEMRKVDAYAGEVFGQVFAPSACLRASPPGTKFKGIWVRLYADRKGPDPRVSKQRVGRNGEWLFDGLGVGGPLYAKVAARHHPGLADCSGAKSRRVFPGR